MFSASAGVALVLVLAGCGGSSSHKSNPPPPPASSTAPVTTTSSGASLSISAYRARLHEINVEVTQSTHKVTLEARRVRSVSDLKQVLERYAGTQARIAGELSSLNPPARAAKANALLARGFRDSAAQLRALFPRLSSMKSPLQAFAFLQRRQPKGAQEIQRALAQLQQLNLSAGS